MNYRHPTPLTCDGTFTAVLEKYTLDKPNFVSRQLYPVFQLVSIPSPERANVIKTGGVEYVLTWCFSGQRMIEVEREAIRVLQLDDIAQVPGLVMNDLRQKDDKLTIAAIHYRTGLTFVRTDAESDVLSSIQRSAGHISDFFAHSHVQTAYRLWLATHK